MSEEITEEITENRNVSKNAAAESADHPDEFTADGKPRFIRSNEGTVFPWSKMLAKKAGFIECDAKGKPMGDVMDEETVKEIEVLKSTVVELKEMLEAKDGEAAAKLGEFQKKAEGEKQILGEEYKASQAKVKELTEELKSVKAELAKAKKPAATTKQA